MIVSSTSHLNCPDFALESGLHALGKLLIAGVDEAGRGPLAGPVVAAAVILDKHAFPQGLNDSKKLSEKRRELLFAEILRCSIAVSWSSIHAGMIDEINILQATLLSMEKAVDGLGVVPDHILIDGNQLPLAMVDKASGIVKGDSRSLSIAAASIIAKVVRDRMMMQADSYYPVYGFASHKGYGSKSHRTAIAKFGPSPIHRMSFSPMKGR